MRNHLVKERFVATDFFQARELERMGRENRLEMTGPLLASFEAELAALIEAVRRQVRGEGSHA